MDTNRIYVSTQRDYVCWGEVDFDLPPDDAGVRGKITDFSDSSRSRLQRAIKNAVADYQNFVTLTYPPGFGCNGKRVKRDLDVFIKRLRRVQAFEVDSEGVCRCGAGRSWSVLWWQEWQANGRIHFHLACTHYIDKDWLSQIWCEIVDSKNPDHLLAGTNIKKLSGGRSGVAAYAAKYMAKREQKVAPEGWEQVGRFWGIAGDRRTVAAATTLSPRQASDARVSGLLDELIIEIEEAIVRGDLEELPIQDDERVMRHWKILNETVALRLQLLVRRINLQRAVVDSCYSGAKTSDPVIFSGLHTRMFYVEDVSELK